MQWGRKVNKNNTLPLLYIMEETGFYYEALAYFLNENNCKVVLVLPSKVKKYMQSLPMKTKTDKVGARDLAQLGLEREHTLWVPPIEIDKILWDLSRERELKIERIVKTKNQIMELNKSQDKNPNTVKRLEVEIEFLNKHINEIEKEINLILESDPELKEKVEKL